MFCSFNVFIELYLKNLRLLKLKGYIFELVKFIFWIILYTLAFLVVVSVSTARKSGMPTDIGVVYVRNHAETGTITDLDVTECLVIPCQHYQRSPDQMFYFMVNDIHTVYEEERQNIKFQELIFIE